MEKKIAQPVSSAACEPQQEECCPLRFPGKVFSFSLEFLPHHQWVPRSGRGGGGCWRRSADSQILSPTTTPPTTTWLVLCTSFPYCCSCNESDCGRVIVAVCEESPCRSLFFSSTLTLLLLTPANSPQPPGSSAMQSDCQVSLAPCLALPQVTGMLCRASTLTL